MLAVSSLALFGLGCATFLILIAFAIGAFKLMRSRARRHAEPIALVVASTIAAWTALATLIPLLALPIRQAGLFWLGYFGTMVVFEFVFHIARGVYGARHPGSGTDLFGPPELHEERLRHFDRMTQQGKRFGTYAIGVAALTVALTVFALVAAIVQASSGGAPAKASELVTRQEVLRVFAKEGIHLTLFPAKQRPQPVLALGFVPGGSVQVVIADCGVSLPHSLSRLRSGGGPHMTFGARVVNNLLIQWGHPRRVRAG